MYYRKVKAIVYYDSINKTLYNLFLIRENGEIIDLSNAIPNTVNSMQHLLALCIKICHINGYQISRQHTVYGNLINCYCVDRSNNIRLSRYYYYPILKKKRVYNQ